ENELLRNIVVRERQEEARGDEARKLVLAELDRLKVRSELLNKEIEFLAQPVTRLTSEELALFRQPVVSISSEKPGVLKMSFVFEKKSTPNVGKSNAISTAAPNALPNELQGVAVAARKNVEQGKYRTAEKQYQTVLAKDPKNLDALSNLGVVYFRTGKIRTTPTRILISRLFSSRRYLHRGNLPGNITRARQRSGRNQVRLWKDCYSDRKIELQLIL